MPDPWLARFTSEEFLDDAPPPARRAEPAGFRGRDDSGTIEVTVDDSNVVTAVGVPPGWRDSVEPRELGKALLTASNNAIVARLREQVRGLDAPAPDAGRRDDASDAYGNPSSPVARGLVAEIEELMARFPRDLALHRERLREAATATAVEPGPNRRVRVAASAGRVTAVEVDPRWARTARHTEIRMEATAALRAATGRAAPVDPARVPLPPSLARLRELAADPDALRRQLGLG